MLWSCTRILRIFKMKMCCTWLRSKTAIPQKRQLTYEKCFLSNMIVIASIDNSKSNILCNQVYHRMFISRARNMSCMSYKNSNSSCKNVLWKYQIFFVSYIVSGNIYIIYSEVKWDTTGYVHNIHVLLSWAIHPLFI